MVDLIKSAKLDMKDIHNLTDNELQFEVNIRLEEKKKLELLSIRIDDDLVGIKEELRRRKEKRQLSEYLVGKH